MSLIEYQLLDPDTGLGRYTGVFRPAPITLLGPYTITSATNGLTTGVALVKLPAGAVIYDVGIFITTGFDGTTPLLDVGSFTGVTGLFDQLAGAAVPLDDPVTEVTDNDGLNTDADANSWLADAVGSVGAAAGAAYFPSRVYVSAETTISAVVSQNGQKGGTATGASTGTALVYLLATTPVTI